MTQPTFTITIDEIKTTTINDIPDAVKQIGWTLTGTIGNQSMSLPVTTVVPDPIIDNFVPYADLTQDIVISWVELNEPRISDIKDTITTSLSNLIIEASMIKAPLPWVTN